MHSSFVTHRKSQLAPLFKKYQLGEHLSKAAFKTLIRWNNVSSDRSKNEDGGLTIGKAKQTWAIPELYTLMANKLQFNAPTSLAQRTAIVASLMYANLLSDDFNSRMEKLTKNIPRCSFGEGGKPGHPGSRAPVKGYARTFNKVRLQKK